MKKISSAAMVALALVLTAWSAVAQTWPDRVVRILVGTAPGGSADTLARLLAERFADVFKQSFVVENRTGAGGLIAMELVKKSTPDGYTLLVTGGSQHTILPAMMKAFPYDPVQEVTYLAYLGGPPTVLLVHPGMGVSDLRQFITHAKESAGKLSFGSPGTGTHGHLTAEHFKQLAGIEMSHVPYRGSNPALVDLLAGHVPVASMTLPGAAPHILSGKAKALAVTAPARVAGFPDLPTYAEAGYPDLSSVAWFSLSGPPGMPPDIVRRLNAETYRILARPEVRDRLRPEGFVDPSPLDPDALSAFVAAELKRWSAVVRKAGVRMEE